MNKIIEKIKSFIGKNDFNTTFSVKISSKDKINLLEQLSNLLNSGIPLMNSFKIIMYQTSNKKMKNLIKSFTGMLNK